MINRIIATVAPKPREHLVEIGPGQGAITGGLLRAANRLDVVELDRDLIQPLRASLGGLGELRVHNHDALEFAFCRLVENSERLRIVGNLPYNISTPLLFHLLDQAGCIDDMHFMLQKEVVDRMTADPCCKAYGRLSVMVQSRCEALPLFDIPPSAFNPAPKVNSTFVRVTPFPEPRFVIDDPPFFSRLVAQSFNQRRKTLRNSLKELVTAEQMIRADVDPGLRAERLEVADFVRLANLACKPPELS